MSSLLGELCQWLIFVNEGEKVKVLPCKHCFHEACVMPWFSKNSKCPNCRFDLGNDYVLGSEQDVY